MLEFLNNLNWTAIIIAAMACLSAMAIASNLNQSAKKWRDIEWARNERTQKKAPAAISLILQEGAKVHETGENQ
jgi:outer membrane receptor for ferrienterochelin and colicin